jgi:hypothetical protein
MNHDPQLNNKSIPLCTIYSYNNSNKNDNSNNMSAISVDYQGPVITFNLSYCDGSPVPFGMVQEKALEEKNIQLRSGCFCNLGACQEMLQLSAEELEIHYYLGRKCTEDRNRSIDIVDGKYHTGACRISFGYGSTQEDGDIFIQFLIDCFLNQYPPYRNLSLLSHPMDSIGENMNAFSSADDQYHHHHHYQDLFFLQEIQHFPSWQKYQHSD